MDQRHPTGAALRLSDVVRSADELSVPSTNTYRATAVSASGAAVTSTEMATDKSATASTSTVTTTMAATVTTHAHDATAEATVLVGGAAATAVAGGGCAVSASSSLSSTATSVAASEALILSVRAAAADAPRPRRSRTSASSKRLGYASPYTPIHVAAADDPFARQQPTVELRHVALLEGPASELPKKIVRMTEGHGAGMVVATYIGPFIGEDENRMAAVIAELIWAVNQRMMTEGRCQHTCGRKPQQVNERYNAAAKVVADVEAGVIAQGTKATERAEALVRCPQCLPAERRSYCEYSLCELATLLTRFASYVDLRSLCADGEGEGGAVGLGASTRKARALERLSIAMSLASKAASVRENALSVNGRLIDDVIAVLDSTPSLSTKLTALPEPTTDVLHYTMSKKCFSWLDVPRWSSKAPIPDRIGDDAGWLGLATDVNGETGGSASTGAKS